MKPTPHSIHNKYFNYVRSFKLISKFVNYSIESIWLSFRYADLASDLKERVCNKLVKLKTQTIRFIMFAELRV